MQFYIENKSRLIKTTHKKITMDIMDNFPTVY